MDVSIVVDAKIPRTRCRSYEIGCLKTKNCAAASGGCKSHPSQVLLAQSRGHWQWHSAPVARSRLPPALYPRY